MEDKYILFWSTYNNDDVNIEIWRNKKIQLSKFHILTLLSHIKLKNKTYLYTYQNIKKSKIPKSIILKDANEILPDFVAFNALKNGHSIAHISDAVRLKVASTINGIVIDMDAVILKKFPKVDSFFSSMPAKATGGFAPKWGKSHPPLTVYDNSWDGKALSAFPLKVNNITAKSIESLAHKIMINLKTKPKGWNYILWTIKKIIKLDKNAKVFKPINCCPVPSWLYSGKCYSLESPTRLNGKTELFGYKLPSIENIFNDSYIIQHFFESAFSKSKTVNDDFWEKLPNKCLLEMEAKHILGDNWLKEINSFEYES